MDGLHKLKELSEYLSELESDLAMFFELSVDPLCIIDKDGCFLKVNPAWTQVLGYRRDELVGRPYLDFVHPDDHISTMNAANSLLTSDLLKFKNRYKHKFGGYRLFSWSASRCDDKGTIYCTARDVTEREEHMKAVRLSEARLRTICDMIPLGVFFTDEKGSCLYTNNAWQALTGLTFTEALGSGWVACIHPDDRDKVIKYWHECVEKQGTYELSYRYVHKNGTVYNVHCTSERIYDNLFFVGYVGLVVNE